MLFDLQGKRRRVVQGTYLMLAVVMGGGLVFLGVGSDVSGGLVDAFTERGGGGGNGNQIIEERVEENEERLAANPPNEMRVRAQLVRDYYSLATSATTDGQGFSEDARGDLRRSAENWQAYLALEPERIDTSLAGLVLQLYDPNVLNRPQEAKEAAQLIAREDEDANSYLNLIQYAVLAGDTRTADLAAQRAVDLAPEGQEREVRRQAEQLKMPQTAQGGAGAPQGGAGAPQGGGAPPTPAPVP